MKNQFFAVWLALALMALFVGSCNEKENTADTDPVLSVNPSVTDIVFSADGDMLTGGGSDIAKTFRIETNQKSWDVSVSDTWVHLSNKTFNRFTIGVNPAGVTAPEPAVITIIAGDATPVKIGVHQLGAEPSLIVMPVQRDILFTANGETALSNGETITPVFDVYTNVPEWEAVSSDESWLTVSIEDDSFRLIAANNPNDEARDEATVTVTAGEAPPIIIHVQQGGKPFLYVTPEQSNIHFSGSGLTATVSGEPFTPDFSVDANEIWDALSDQGWLKVNKTGNTFTLSALKNKSMQPPVPATVTVTAGTAPPVIITVTQEGGEEEIKSRDASNNPVWSPYEAITSIEGVRRYIYKCEAVHPSVANTAFNYILDWHANDTYWQPGASVNIGTYVTGAGTDPVPSPLCFTIDMGRKAMYSRFKFISRPRTPSYSAPLPVEFDIWGCNNPRQIEDIGTREENQAYWSSWEIANGTDAWKNDWVKLASCTLVLETGGNKYVVGMILSAADEIRYRSEGWEFQFNMGVTEAFQYLRFEVHEINTTDRQLNICAMKFWGIYAD